MIPASEVFRAVLSRTTNLRRDPRMPHGRGALVATFPRFSSPSRTVTDHLVAAEGDAHGARKRPFARHRPRHVGARAFRFQLEFGNARASERLCKINAHLDVVIGLAFGDRYLAFADLAIAGPREYCAGAGLRPAKRCFGIGIELCPRRPVLPFVQIVQRNTAKAALRSWPTA